MFGLSGPAPCRPREDRRQDQRDKWDAIHEDLPDPRGFELVGGRAISRV